MEQELVMVTKASENFLKVREPLKYKLESTIQESEEIKKQLQSKQDRREKYVCFINHRCIFLILYFRSSKKLFDAEAIVCSKGLNVVQDLIQANRESLEEAEDFLAFTEKVSTDRDIQKNILAMKSGEVLFTCVL